MPEKGDSMDTIITNATGYSSVEYSRLLEQAQAKGVSAAKVDKCTEISYILNNTKIT